VSTDRVATIVLWLQRLAQLIGVVLALLGGGQAVQIASSPETYGSAENINSSGTLTISGLLMTFLAPIVAKAVTWFVAWKAGKRATPVADYAAALVAWNVLNHYLASRPEAAAPLATLKTLGVATEADNQTAVIVEAK